MTSVKNSGQTVGLASRRCVEERLDQMKSKSTQNLSGLEHALLSMLTFVPESRIEAMMSDFHWDFRVELRSVGKSNGAGTSNGVENLNFVGNLTMTRKDLKLFPNGQPPDYWPRGPELGSKPT